MCGPHRCRASYSLRLSRNRATHLLSSGARAGCPSRCYCLAVATTIHRPLHDPQRPLYGSAWCTTMSCHLLSALSTSFACYPSCPHMSSHCRRCQPVTRSCHRFSAPQRRCRHCPYRHGRRRAGFMQTRSRHQDIRLLCHTTRRRWADGLREECSPILA